MHALNTQQYIAFTQKRKGKQVTPSVKDDFFSLSKDFLKIGTVLYKMVKLKSSIKPGVLKARQSFWEHCFITDGA